MNKVTVQEVVDAINDLSMAVLELSTPDDEFNLDYRAMRTRYKALTERIQTHGIEVAYTPMTDEEIIAVYAKWFVTKYGYQPHTISSVEWESAFEQAVLARLGVAPTYMRTNPYTGTPRDYRDVNSDPEGLAIVEAGKPLPAKNKQSQETLDQAKRICEANGFVSIASVLAALPKLNAPVSQDSSAYRERYERFNKDMAWVRERISMLESAKEVKP